MTVRLAVGAGLCFAARAAEQVWNENGEDNVWSASAPNWDAGVPWTDGGTAVFSGTGGVVEVSGAVMAAGMTFLTNGYVIADADGDGALTLSGAPGTIAVQGAGSTGIVAEAIAGSGGFTKTGDGVLQLATNNTYAGVTTVSQGILRLGPLCPNALGATGTGNGTVVAEGATLDLNGAYNGVATTEAFAAAGSGVNGLGAIVNTGLDHVNRSTGALTLQGDTVIGGPRRIDINDIVGNGYTLVKRGTHQLCVRNLQNAAVVIDEGQYTILSDNRALGGTTPGDTIINGSGNLNCWGTLNVSERIVFNGGILSEGEQWRLFTLSGHLTLNDGITRVSSGSDRGVALTGFVNGPGGLRQVNAGWFILANPTNAYTGPTICDVGRSLFVGWTNGLAGAWGQGVLTNSGDVYFWSGASGRGPVVNMDTGRLFFDRPGVTCVFASNTVSGAGKTYVRYGADAVLNAVDLSNSVIRVNDGNLTLTNGAAVRLSSQISVAELSDRADYPSTISNVNATLTIHDGCLLETASIAAGNGASGTSLTGRVVQVGGTVRTTGWTGDTVRFPDEYDGLHLGHWPACAEFVYEMRGGELIVGNGYRLAIAIDGQGWFHQTGGGVSASEVVVNGRNDTKGYGRLTLEGGALNVGSNGITAGTGAPYLVEYGGGAVRATTNFASSLNATLTAAGAAATVFDTKEWNIALSGNLTGTGGLNKAGSGTLTLSGANSYGGGTTVLAGTLRVDDRASLPDGALKFGVAPGDAGGRVHAAGGLSLAGLVVGVANPEALDKEAHYTVATWGGELTAGFEGFDLPAPWTVGIDPAGKRAFLFAETGTVLWLR
jgi:autotransporter-associated beta strand protein